MKNILIIGPTATGKTALALGLAKLFDAEIVSVDSRQIYKKMDVGTGKVRGKAPIQKREGFWVVGGIKISGFDLIEPDQVYSAVDFCSYASRIRFEKEVVFWVGGTGFYFDALLGNIKFSGVGRDDKLRDELNRKSTEELFLMLAKVSPKRAETIDKKNKVRLMRALEISEKGQEPVASKIPENPVLASSHLIVGLTSSRENLYKNCDLWTEEMLGAGLIDETKTLLDLRYKNTAPLSGIVYKSVVSYLEGETTLEAAKERIKFDLHAYVRRQQTYFKKFKKALWFDVAEKGFDSGVKASVQSYLDE